MTIEDIKAYATANGSFFFSPDSMRFFSSRLSSTTYFGGIFITSEVYGDRKRVYTVRRVLESGTIVALSDKFSTLSQAKSAAKYQSSILE